MTDSIERFMVGFISALLVPIAKYALSSNIYVLDDLSFFIGALIPFVLLGIVIGLYALVVEKEQKDMKTLFKICVGLPAMLMTLGNVDLNKKAIASDRELVCEKTHELVQGVISTYDSLTNSNRTRYWLLSKTVGSNEYILIEKEVYWVIGHSDKLPKGELVFDVLNCKLLEAKK